MKKTLALITVLLAAVAANAVPTTFNVVCRKAGFETPYSFSGVGTVTVDVQPGKPKHANDIKVEEILAASMPNLVVATPDGQFPIRNASMKEEEKAEAYTIPANDDMGETIVIKMTGQASGATGELQMVLKGPPSGATSKIIYNSNIYWSNCQFVP